MYNLIKDQNTCFTRGIILKRIALGVIATFLLGFLFTGCTGFISRDESGYTLTEKQEYENLEILAVDIKMGVGQLNIEGGTQDLFQADFIYSVDRWKPEVVYHSKNKRGSLSVITPSSFKNVNLGKQKYQWDIALNEKSKIDLDLELGVGKSNLSLNTLNLQKVDIEMGVGETEIDLRGDWQEDVQANIQGGIGKVTILLPKDMDVELKVSQGIGKISTNKLEQKGNFYFNKPNYNDGPALKVDIKAGIGEIELK